MGGQSNGYQSGGMNQGYGGYGGGWGGQSYGGWQPYRPMNSGYQSQGLGQQNYGQQGGWPQQSFGWNNNFSNGWGGGWGMPSFMGWGMPQSFGQSNQFATGAGMGPAQQDLNQDTPALGIRQMPGRMPPVLMDQKGTSPANQINGQLEYGTGYVPNIPAGY